jgi:hypothetical protein
MSELTLEFRQNKAIITLNKPTKLNALTVGQFYLLASYLREAAKRPDIHITILTGTGRFFSSCAAGIQNLFLNPALTCWQRHRPYAPSAHRQRPGPGSSPCSV